MKNLAILVSFLFFYMSGFGQQGFTVNLYIFNENGESVINANTIIDDKINLSSNQFGYLATKLDSGSHDLIISHISYQNRSLFLNLISDTTITLVLVPNTLEAVEILSQEKKDIIYLEDISLANFEAIPGLTGTADIISNLTLLPGISNGKEGNIGFSVRGGETYQNSILIDRSLLLNPSHLFGFLSTINSKVVNDVKLYKNHVPARFGNSSASVVDIDVKNGNRDSLIYNFDLGLTNSSLVVEGPITPKVTFLVGARTAYLGLLTSPVYLQFQRGKIENYANYNFYDYNLKFKYSQSPSDRITLHVYRSRDNILAQSRLAEESVSSFAYSWQNTAVNLSQYKQFRNGLFWNNYLSYSNYATDLRNSVKFLNVEDGLQKSSRSSDFNNISYQSQVSKNFGVRNLLRLGMNYEQLDFSPIILKFNKGDDERTFKALTFKLNTLAIYVDNDLQLLSKVNLNYGLRLAHYFFHETKHTVLEPRLSMKFEIDRDRFLEASYNKLSQNRIQFPLQNFGFPLDINIPISDRIAPPQTNQLSLSFVDNYFFSKYLSTVISLYYKNIWQLTTIDKVVPFINNFDEKFQDKLAFDGIGKAYGFEFSLVFSAQKQNLTLNYHLSRSLRKYPNINNAEWFAHEFDRPHELNIIYSRNLSNKWSYFVNFALFSGIPTSLPSGVIEISDDVDFYLFSKRNNYRLPAYHRANVSIVRKAKTARNRANQLTFAIYNAYYNRNVYDIILVREENSSDFTFKKLSVFPIIPSINYSISF